MRAPQIFVIFCRLIVGQGRFALAAAFTRRKRTSNRDRIVVLFRSTNG
jgi:hypothetical protein